MVSTPTPHHLTPPNYIPPFQLKNSSKFLSICLGFSLLLAFFKIYLFIYNPGKILTVFHPKDSKDG